MFHIPLNKSKISTTFEGPDPFHPPAKSAYRLSIDVAARLERASLKVAVVHVLLGTLNTSTTFDVKPPVELKTPPKRTRFGCKTTTRLKEREAVLQLPLCCKCPLDR
jgi:hypothetical protein